MAKKSKAVRTPRARGTKLIVHSPRVWQVFQRITKRRGPVVISGRVTGPADRVEVKFTGKPRLGQLDSPWRSIRLDKATGAFTQSLSLPAGGWYTMDARARVGDRTVATATVKPLGVGEVFVTAGQSNSTSCGEFPTKQTSGMVSAFSGKAWRRAIDPMWGAHDLIDAGDPIGKIFKGGSPWLAFGDAMFVRYGVPIGVAVTGHGGSSVTDWQPGSDMYNWMLTRVHQLGPMGLRAVLWHQGESDVEIADQYAALLTRTIESSRSDAGWELPWMVAKVSYRSPTEPSFESIRQAFDELWQNGAALPGPDTDTLTGDDRDCGGEGIHFSPKGLKAHGRMWADFVAAWLGRP